MSEELEALRRRARPDDLESLRRLDRALQRSGWRVEGKTPREWIFEFARCPLDRYLSVPAEAETLSTAGLAAVPALVEALQARELSPKHELDVRIRAHCVSALMLIQPPPTCAIPALLETLRVRSTRLRRMTLWVLTRKLIPRPTALAARELIACLESTHEPEVRADAARALCTLSGPLPPEVRRAALQRLTDVDKRVRRGALRILARLPAPDSEVRTAIEEQAILDDANRLEAASTLLGFDEPRAFEFLQEEVLCAESSQATDGLRLRSFRALQLIERLGARAEPTLPALRRVSFHPRIETLLQAAVSSIARGQLTARMPAPSPEQLRDERAVRFLAPPPAATPDLPPDKALARWAAGFLPYGRELCARMALAAARRVAVLWENESPLLGTPREALDVLEEWVCDPNDTLGRRVVQEGNVTPSQLCAPSAFSASWSTTFATLCVATDEQRGEWAPYAQPLDSAEGGFLGSAVLSACRALGSRSVITWAMGSSAEPSLLSEQEAADEVRKVILAEVLPWVCGTWDPVVDVIRRRRELLDRPTAPVNTGQYPP
jgi:HEAT repeat protein